MRGDDRVLVVADDSRLRYRDVTVLRREPEEVLVSSGLSAGDWVCISALQTVSEGMQVRVSDEPRASIASGVATEPKL